MMHTQHPPGMMKPPGMVKPPPPPGMVMHMADMMSGPLHAHLGHFTDPAILRKGHNTTKWIAGAIKHPGAFTRKAKAAGKSVAGYAAQALKSGSKASTATKRQAILARTLTKISRSR